MIFNDCSLDMHVFFSKTLKPGIYTRKNSSIQHMTECPGTFMHLLHHHKQQQQHLLVVAVVVVAAVVVESHCKHQPCHGGTVVNLSPNKELKLARSNPKSSDSKTDL